ncbi:energy transducer TonB [Methylocella sp.]|uniref:energy transducer TonB n=1 Tax=Methylocella sp. TaxID=1978226 RepID=UPI00378312E7
MTSAGPQPIVEDDPIASGPTLAPTPEDRLALDAPGTTEAGVAAAIIVSLAVHAGIFGLVWGFGAPEREPPPQEIPVEVVMEQPKPDAAAQAKAEAEKAQAAGKAQAAQEQAAQAKAAQEKAAEKAAEDKAAQEKAAQEKAAEEAKAAQAKQEAKAAEEKAEQEKAAQEVRAVEDAKAAQEKAAQQKAAQEKAAQDAKAQAAAEKKAAQDKKQAEREERRAARAQRQEAEKAAAKEAAAKEAAREAQRQEAAAAAQQAQAEQKFARAPTGLALPFDNGPLLFRAVAVPLPTEGGEEAMSYKVIVFGMLERAKQYPESARERGARGRAVVTFSLNDAGDVTKVSLLRSSGEADLDVESLALVARAAPFPKPPPGAQRDFAAEITFDMRENP